jgi:hypothetical protein
LPLLSLSESQDERKITDHSCVLGVLFEFLQKEKDGGPDQQPGRAHHYVQGLPICRIFIII